MRQDRLAIAVRAAMHALMIGVVGFVLVVTFSTISARAQAEPVLPAAIPDPIAEIRAQPPLGYTVAPPAPGTQPLTPALLANYVARQNALRAFDGFGFGEPGDLTENVLLGYIARGSLGGGNGALDAIASFTAPRPAGPALDTAALTRYVETDYVPTHRRVEIADAERNCLAQAIYHEARGESHEGQMAVANIIVNRALSGRYPDSLCGVIYQNADKGRYRCQFTFACDGRSDVPTERRAWANSQALAARVYAKFAQGRALGALPRSALFYHTTAVRPSWAFTYNRVAQIGSHIFYAP